MENNGVVCDSNRISLNCSEEYGSSSSDEEINDVTYFFRRSDDESRKMHHSCGCGYEYFDADLNDLYKD